MQKSATTQIPIRRYPKNTPKPKINLAFMFRCDFQNALKPKFLLAPFNPPSILPLILQRNYSKRCSSHNN